MRNASILALVTLLFVLTPALPLVAAEEPGNQATVARLEKNADIAFDRKQYMQAIPLYQRLLGLLPKDSAKAQSVTEKLRVAQKALAEQTKADPNAQMAQPTEQVAMAPGERKKHVRPKAGEICSLTIKQLGNFDYDAEKGGNVPDDVKAMAGATVRLRGFMIPLDQTDAITEFALVPSLFACCFGQPPQVQHTIVVHTPKGKAVGYYPDEIVVQGPLKVEERKEDGFVVSLFEVTCTSVKPAPKQP